MDYLGATYLGDDRCHFRVWAPLAREAVLYLEENERAVPLTPEAQGYFATTVEGVKAGSRYTYRLDGRDNLPDPASRHQPQGVHGPSAVVDTACAWTDAGWRNWPLRDYIIYELHIGTFTPAGTFDAAIAELPYLHDLGITAIELLPVSQFPGTRNWGYDGVFLFAVQHSYGGPAGLRRFVDACHNHGIAVIMDVVYNHLGPEGNYLGAFGPYFTDRYTTPWGAAMNVDGPYSDEVRRFFVENALFWQQEYHIDALRLDAIHTIIDQSATPFLAELSQAMNCQATELGQPFYTIAESDLNDPRLIFPPQQGGIGLDAQWADDFHHALDPILTGADNYADDFGQLQQVATAFRQGFVYTGQYAPSRKRRHGGSPEGVAADQLVVFLQNHDQVGNRRFGARYSTMVAPGALRLAAGLVLLSPFIPLLWMGEEYGDPTPWMFFCSFGEPDLIAAVRKGRQEDFARFSGDAEQPDPQDEATFEGSKLHLELREQSPHRALLELYKALIRLRRERPALHAREPEQIEVQAYEAEHVVVVRRQAGGDELALLFNLSAEPRTVAVTLPTGRWQPCFDSAGATGAAAYDFAGSLPVALAAHQFVVLERA